jgi:hypothetical protein
MKKSLSAGYLTAINDVIDLLKEDDDIYYRSELKLYALHDKFEEKIINEQVA